jgi:hypothetical protein
MSDERRFPQQINGEWFPRHSYFGNDVCRQRSDLVRAFADQGIDLMAIPLIDEVQRGVEAEDLSIGTLIGCVAPINEKDFPLAIVWSSNGIVSLPLPMYLQCQNNGWNYIGRGSLEGPSPELERPVQISDQPRSGTTEKKPNSKARRKEKRSALRPTPRMSRS